MTVCIFFIFAVGVHVYRVSYRYPIERIELSRFVRRRFKEYSGGGVRDRCWRQSCSWKVILLFIKFETFFFLFYFNIIVFYDPYYLLNCYRLSAVLFSTCSVYILSLLSPSLSLSLSLPLSLFSSPSLSLRYIHSLPLLFVFSLSLSLFLFLSVSLSLSLSLSCPLSLSHTDSVYLFQSLSISSTLFVRLSVSLSILPLYYFLSCCFLHSASRSLTFLFLSYFYFHQFDWILIWTSDIPNSR